MLARIRPALFKSAAAAAMAWGYMSLKYTPLDDWIQSQKGGHFQFLTIQGLAVSWLAVILGICANLFPSIFVFHRAKRAISLIALPLSITISIIYWSLIALFPQLILRPENPLSEPSASSELTHIPLKTDLALHALPAITMIADFFLAERRYPKSWVGPGALIVSALSGLWYALWVEYCQSYNGRYPYPFLDQPPHIRVPIYVGATSLSYAVLRLLNFLHH